MNKIYGSVVVAEARQWLGTPFHHQGRLKGVGIDCAGLIICTAQGLGLADGFDITDYGRQANYSRMGGILSERMLTVPVNQVHPGDVLWFRIDKDPQHLGIVTDINPLTFIHAFMSSGIDKVVEHSAGQYWTDRIVGAFRYKGVLCN